MTPLASAEHKWTATPVFRSSRRRLRVSAQSRQQRDSAASNDRQNWTDRTRRSLLAQLLVLPLAAQSAQAVGIESIQPPEINIPNKFEDFRKKNQERLDKSDAAFENSDILRTLRERSDANRSKYRRELQDRYCQRQSELGVGDCAGLRLIPGATKSGKQATPEWLKGILEKFGQKPMEEDPAVAKLKELRDKT